MFAETLTFAVADPANAGDTARTMRTKTPRAAFFIPSPLSVADADTPTTSCFGVDPENLREGKLTMASDKLSLEVSANALSVPSLDAAPRRKESCHSSGRSWGT